MDDPVPSTLAESEEQVSLGRRHPADPKKERLRYGEDCKNL